MYKTEEGAEYEEEDDGALRSHKRSSVSMKGLLMDPFVGLSLGYPTLLIIGLGEASDNKANTRDFRPLEHSIEALTKYTGLIVLSH